MDLFKIITTNNMTQKLILLLITLLTLSGCGIKKMADEERDMISNKFKQKYISFLESDESYNFAWYHYIRSVKPNGNVVERMIFPETRQVTSYTTYYSLDNKVKHGLQKEWYDDGTRVSEGHFKNGKEYGEWKYFHYNDEISKVGAYDKGLETGVWKFYDDEGRLKTKMNYEEGVLEGEFVSYDSLANIVNEGIYRADTIYQQSNPNVNVYKKEEIVHTLPMFANCDHKFSKEEQKDCSNENLLKYIYANIQYPSYARIYNVEGKAVVRFYIDKDGRVKDVKVMKGLCRPISEECYSIVKKMPKWYRAGLMDGEPVKVYFNLPIIFRME